LEGSIEKGEPILVGSKCKKCGKIHFPRKSICSECLNEDIEEVKLSRKGKLFAYTIIYVGPLMDRVPYALGYIELPEGVKIFSLLTENDPNKLKIGMDMILTTGEIKSPIDGGTKIVYMFAPQ